jgi:hypothetical protein
MTTLVNDRDVLIQGTVPRFAPPTDRALLVASSAQVFKVAANNVGSPSSIDLTARLLNMVGTVAWSASGGSSLSVAGNTATLNFSSMVGLSCTVTATITVDGQVYTSTQIITKVNDGVTGKSARVAYTKTTLTSLSSAPTTITTAGNTSYPPLDSWGSGTVFGGSPMQLAAGERMMRTDGTYDPFTDTTVWGVPYEAALKVGSLDALTTNTGALTVSGSVSSANGKFSVDSLGAATMSAVTIKDSSGNIVLASGAAGIDYAKVIGAKPIFGGNQCFNSEFALGLDGWNLYFGGGATYTLDWNLSSAWVVGLGTAYIYESGAINPGASGEVRSQEIPVIAGKTYEWSAYTGAHRCRVDVFIYWLNSAGSAIGSTGIFSNDEEQSGGSTLAGYKRCTSIGVAPSGATTALGIIRKNGTKAGQPDSYAFFTRGFFAEAVAGQTLPSVYSVGPSDTKITPANASTYIANLAVKLAHLDTASIGALSALSAIIGTLRTATSGGRMEIADNVQKVFDTSNVMRIRLGNLSL